MHAAAAGSPLGLLFDVRCTVYTVPSIDYLPVPAPVAVPVDYALLVDYSSTDLTRSAHGGERDAEMLVFLLRLWPTSVRLYLRAYVRIAY